MDLEGFHGRASLLDLRHLIVTIGLLYVFLEKFNLFHSTLPLSFITVCDEMRSNNTNNNNNNNNNNNDNNNI